jgi:hypothetical protein
MWSDGLGKCLVDSWYCSGKTACDMTWRSANRLRTDFNLRVGALFGCRSHGSCTFFPPEKSFGNHGIGDGVRIDRRGGLQLCLSFLATLLSATFPTQLASLPRWSGLSRGRSGCLILWILDCTDVQFSSHILILSFCVFVCFDGPTTSMSRAVRK